ncbi:sodium/hydrogen exchanger 3 isoform X2 [Cardiocondyla obscurior]|uniref:sodium/hydrogen exchanger 3 isoform X2 n=1 Tax=Cardiocondyla obscurior TaxID=286306 RepID=UPI0039656F2C
MGRLVPMIIPALLFVALCCPGCGRADLASNELGSAERVAAEKPPASHGPQADSGDFPSNLDRAYPGLDFGPMGPMRDKSALPNDATLRSLSSAGVNDAERLPEESRQLASAQSGDDAAADATSIGQQSPKPEYHIVSVEFTRVETPFLIGIWIFFASIAKIGFHMAPKLNKIFPESCLLIAVGVIVGLLLFQASSVHISPLTPDTFFLYMLPPIILDAGYFMPNRLFFDHLGTILLFAVVGTIFNTMSIGGSLWLLGKSGIFGFDAPILDMFLFSALISAVDPVAVLAVFEEIHVNEILYIVVFGESLLNDAVTVVLYHMFETYSEMGPSRIIYTDVLAGLASFLVVAFGGTVIGIVWGFATGFVTRFTHQVRVIEPIFIFVMAYLAYLSAEIFHLSGILAITFCGITMKNYVEANISHKSHTTVKYTMKMLSSSSETIIFMFLGVATVNNAHNWNTWFIVMTIVFCSIYRAVGVIVLTALANQFRLHKLDKVEKFVMSYGGLRGAVAFALVLLIDPKHVPLQPMFVTTTIAVIYFTVFIQGITIKPLVKILNVKRAEKRKPTMNERIHERIMDHTMAGIEDILGKHGNYHVRDKFKRFDNKFIRPYLVRDHCGAEPKILETYSKLAMKDALDYIRRNASTIGNISGTESMSAIFRNYSNTGQFNGSPSCSQLEAGWNIDLQELEYNPSKKDLTDARIHHLLAEELCKPYKRHRRLSYSRHAVNDRDLSTQVNYKMHMNIRRMVGEHKHRHKRSKKLLKVRIDRSFVICNYDVFHFPLIDCDSAGRQTEPRQFPRVSTAERLDEVIYARLHQWRAVRAGKRRNLEALEQRGLGFGDHVHRKNIRFAECKRGQSARYHRYYVDGYDKYGGRRLENRTRRYVFERERKRVRTFCVMSRFLFQRTFFFILFSTLEIIINYWFCIAANQFSLCIFLLIICQVFGFFCQKLDIISTDLRSSALPYAENSKSGEIITVTISCSYYYCLAVFDLGAEGYRVTTPTATETMLPWKREDDYESGHPIKQHEFPPWCSNKEYLAYSSPSATFLGGIEQPKVQSVIGLFRRESVCTPDSIDCQETVEEADETDEYTPAKVDSPAKTKGT